MKLSVRSALYAGILLSASSAAKANLVDRGGGLIYDTDLNITWLSNANYGQEPLSFGMTWQNAMDWAANLSYHDSANGATYSGWRLPTTLTPDPSCSMYSQGYAATGDNCSGSELGHLFYSELGGVAGSSIGTTHNSNYNLFTNIQSDRYWSSTEYVPGSSYRFYTVDGYQGARPNDYLDANNNLVHTQMYAWAVHSGDIAAVPAPAAAWLFGSGLLGLLGIGRRSKQPA